MGLFSGLKRALGYSDADLEAEEDDVAYVGNGHRTPYVNPFKKEPEPEADVEEDVQVTVHQPASATPAVKAETAVAEVEEKLPDGVFDGIITIINSNLPEFVRDCIDIERERKAVYIAMGPQFRDYVVNLRRTSLEEARKQWVDERNTLQKKLVEAESLVNESNKKASEYKEKAMSEERQRRAIVERSHDLEARISDLEANAEQDRIQNMSLLNKIKVMQVQATDVEKAEEEVARLNQVVNEMRQQMAGLREVEVQLAEANTEKDRLAEELEQLKQNNATEQLEAEFKTKMDLTNAMISDLRDKVAAKELEVKELLAKLEETEGVNSSLKEEVAQLNSDLSIATELQEKIGLFEGIKAKKDEEIRRLKAELEAALGDNSKVEALESQLKDSDIQRVELQNKIKALEQQIAQANEASSIKDAEAASRIEDLKSQLSAAGERLEAALGDNSKVEALESQLKDSDIQRVELQNKIKALEQQIAQANEASSIKDAEAASRIEDLKSQLSAAGERLEAALGDNSKVEALESQLKDSDIQRVELQNKIKALEQQIAQANEASSIKDAEAANQIEDLKSQLEAASEKLEAAFDSNVKIEELEAQLQDGDIKRVALQNKVKELEQSIVDVNDANRAKSVESANKIDELMRQLSATNKKLEEAEDAIEKNNAIADSNDKELKKLKADNMALDVQVKNLRANVADRDVEIAELRNKLSESGVDYADEIVEEIGYDVVSRADGTSTVSAIDDIDDIDWLMPSPPTPAEPAPVPAPAPKEVEKPRAHEEVSSAQMSLFD